MSRSRRFYLLPILILLAVTLPHLEQGEFRRDTVRYAAIGLYMYQGGSLLTPYANAEKMYFNKPPLALWIHGLFLKLFRPNLMAARIPSILAAIGVLVFSMLSIRNLGTRREAVISGIVLASTYEFFRRTREISIDMWQLFFILISVWLITKTIRTGVRWPVIVCGIPIGLALLCKQFVGLMALPVFAIWLALAGRRGVIKWLFLGALPVSILVATPWHIYMYAAFGDSFAKRYFGHEVVERVTKSNESGSIFYYLGQNVRTYWPWMLGLAYAVFLAMKRLSVGARGHVPALKSGPAAAGSPHSKRRHEFVSLAAIWVGFWLIAISLFTDKKPNYALPLYPMLSWIVAWGLCRLPSTKLKSWYDRGLPWLAPATVAVFLIAALAPIRFQEPPEKNWLALVNWMNANKIDVARLAYTNLEQNDVCYVYLKTGQWMRTLESERTHNESEKLLVVTKISKEAKHTANENVVFSSGPVRVFSESR